jgi:hypothetical protein
MGTLCGFPFALVIKHLLPYSLQILQELSAALLYASSESEMLSPISCSYMSLYPLRANARLPAARIYSQAGFRKSKVADASQYTV